MGEEGRAYEDGVGQSFLVGGEHHLKLFWNLRYGQDSTQRNLPFSKASKFSSVLTNMWACTGYTLEACFPLRVLMPIVFIKSSLDLRPIRMAAIKNK